MRLPVSLAAPKAYERVVFAVADPQSSSINHLTTICEDNTMATNTAPLAASVKAAVHDAAAGGQKIAMFHFQILKNADALETTSPEAFCKAIGVPETYKTEFRKMLSLARVMRQAGVKLSDA